MKITGILAVCALAALASGSTATAQESSKLSPTSAGIDITELLARFAKRTGKKIVIDPRVRAQVPLAGMDPSDISYDQLLTILDVHQFAIAETGGLLIVTPDANSRQLATPVYDDVNFKALDHEIVTLIVSPKKVCAMYLVPVLRPMMPQSAHLAAEVQTNSLIINDRTANVRRIARMVDDLDKRAGEKQSCETTPSWSTAPARPAADARASDKGG